MDTEPGFVVTAWRNRQELLQLRQDLYNASDKVCRQKAVNKVFAWRLRKPDGLPLLLDSTADIVDVILQDERSGLAHNALRLLYATAISRFVTGLADTQIDLSRDRPRWFAQGKSLQLPLSLLEIRHRIVHRHLPSLAELKRAAAASLEWLWDWYWSQLETAFGLAAADGGQDEAADEEIGVETTLLIKEKLQSLLKTYLKDRKTEIKNNPKDDGFIAVLNAGSTYATLCSTYSIPNTRALPHKLKHLILTTLLDPRTLLPTQRKLGNNMSGAFLIWTPLLLAFCISPDYTTTPATIPLSALLSHMLAAMNGATASRTPSTPETDPVREAWCEWVLHVLTSQEWDTARWAVGEAVLVEEVLAACLCEPSYWNLKVVERVLGEEGVEVRDRDGWRRVLAAARGEGGAEGEDEVSVEAIEDAVAVGEAVLKGGTGAVGEKIQGPGKVVGMWKASPLGWVPEGWEDDE